MINSRSALVNALHHYRTVFANEHAYIDTIQKLLLTERCFHRDHMPAHITASAWITDSNQQLVLLTHHAKLDAWLQPGGHADGDDDVMRVVMREASEETGLINLTLHGEDIFDIDIHTIPAYQSVPEHKHYDIRFHFTANPHEALTITRESKDLKWIPLSSLEDYTSNASIIRMRSKTFSNLYHG